MSELKNSVGKKVLSISELEKVLAIEKINGRAVVHCHGVFDLVHPGHIRHLKAASVEGDILVVTITSDRFVNKGPGRPVYNHNLRAETLAALEFVDYVAVNDSSSAVDIISRITPAVYVKGNEYAVAGDDVTGMIDEERRAVEADGGRVHFTDEIVMSSSELLNAYFDVFRPETQGWLNGLRERYSQNDIIEHLHRLKDVRVLVVGEAIIDEYVFCDGLGKSAKDPILAFKYSSEETHAGGSLAVANHLAGICDSVGLVTLLGEKDNQEKFVKDKLHSNIKLMALSQRGAPTIHKKRYVDNHTGSKIFELYTYEDTPLDVQTEDELKKTLSDHMGEYDVVVVADYGHGMISPIIVDLLIEGAPFLAVNTQANAGNQGFNTISKYRRADYVCLNGGEVRLETRMRGENIRDLVREIAGRLDCEKYTVTLGRDGTLHYESGIGFIEAPALALNVADRVGAGDAVLAVTAPMVALGIPWEVIGFVGNLAGAEMVAELGTSRALETANLIKHVQSILK